jgi:hypothetical protein
METFSERPTTLSALIKHLNFLEERIKRLEEHLGLEALTYQTEISESVAVQGKNDNMEFQIGEFWFAKVGVVILAIGVIFVLTLPYSGLPAYVPSVIGYLISLLIVGLYYLLKKSFTFISKYLLGSSLLLLYFSTLRLHFFSEQQALGSSSLLILLLLIVVVFNLTLSIKRKSVYLTAVNLTLGYITAIASDNALFIFIMISFLSASTVLLKLKLQWKNLVIYGLFLTYITHLLWFVNNPFMGHKMQFVHEAQYNLYFVLLYFLIYTSGHLLRPKDEPEDSQLIFTTILNCIASYGIFLLISILTANDSILKFHLSASVIFLLLSYVFWIRVKSKYSSFFYSILGFSALSVAIIAGFDKPDFFILLCWQSLLVVALALLYRSKIIVIANFFIFLIIFLSYLFTAEKVGGISISFGVVALLSARVLNWQKNRLEIQTEAIRNSYLFIAFIIFPYALYHMLPGWYVSISWAGLAIFYYGLSVLLKINKYRWLALMTLVLSILYLFIIGIRQPDPFYRIITFVSLGVILLLVSIFYSRTKLKQGEKSEKK